MEVDADIRVTGGELQMVGSTCATRAPADEGYLCFDGEEFLVSANADGYTSLAGVQGIQGERGPEAIRGCRASGADGRAGADGVDGGNGGTARRWLPGADVAASFSATRNLRIVGSGLPASQTIALILRDPNGVVAKSYSVSSTETGTILLVDFGVFCAFPGVYTLIAQLAGEDTVLATHPVQGVAVPE